VTVLVIDDDRPLMEGLVELLEEDGYAAVSASNGREALDMLSDGLKPDVILLDLVMPVMNGWEFRREQMHDDALKSIPVVVFTAAGFSASRVKAEFGEIEFVPKPPPFGAIVAAVERSLQRRR
jgi:CheY-like chemotaxis protein